MGMEPICGNQEQHIIVEKILPHLIEPELCFWLTYNFVVTIL